MVGMLVRRHSSRHRRATSILAQRAISLVSPLRESDRRRERRRLARNRRTHAKAAVLRDMRSFFGLPQPRRQQRVVAPPRVDPAPPVVVLTDTSFEDIQPPPPTPQPVLVDLDSSLDTLPDIDPRPQWQLPVDLTSRPSSSLPCSIKCSGRPTCFCSICSFRCCSPSLCHQSCHHGT